MQQRAIPGQLLPLVLEYGRHEHAGDGCQRWRLTRKAVLKMRRDLKAIMSQLDSAQDTYLIESGDGAIVTVGHVYRSGGRQRRR
jgi:hypothetical protein